ncbi:MAG TPA: DNA repair protein RecO [Actinomycetota bacterium]|nr:DNA repair protein RecO [Actinomycetota bacterium]
MPGLYKDEAVVLKTIKLGEADRIVTLFTRANGKVRAVAKGIRKTKSRFGARLEPFTHATLVVYRGRDLDVVTSADIVTSFHEIRDHYPSLTSAAALAEMVDKITPERERAFSTYALLLAGLHALAERRGESVVPAFAVKLLSISGYHPHLSACSSCGGGGPFAGLSAAVGGSVCERCARADRSAYRMPPDRIPLLGRLLASDFGHPAEPDAVADLVRALRGYAEYHLERPLRGLRFVAT